MQICITLVENSVGMIINYAIIINEIIMTLECLALNPLRKEKFHQDNIDLRSPIIIYVHERFLKF